MGVPEEKYRVKIMIIKPVLNSVLNNFNPQLSVYNHDKPYQNGHYLYDFTIKYINIRELCYRNHWFMRSCIVCYDVMKELKS